MLAMKIARSHQNNPTEFSGIKLQAERPHIAPGKGRLPFEYRVDKHSSDNCMYFGCT